MCKLMNSLGLDELYECTGDNYYRILRSELKDLVRQFILRNIYSTVHSFCNATRRGNEYTCRPALRIPIIVCPLDLGCQNHIGPSHQTSLWSTGRQKTIMSAAISIFGTLTPIQKTRTKKD